MATAPPVAAPGQAIPSARPVQAPATAVTHLPTTGDPGIAPAVESGSEQALVLAPRTEEAEADEPALRGPAARLPVEMDVSVPVREFRVRHLLALEPGRVIESQWNHGNDLPLAAGQVRLAWSEFEVVDTRLAVRVTRLA